MKNKSIKKWLQIGLAVVLAITFLLGGCMSDLASDAILDTNDYYVTNLYSWNGTAWVDTALGGGGGGGGLWQVAGGDTELIIADSLDIQSQFIHNVLDPVLNQDAATKIYVDNADTVLANDIATNATAIANNAAAIAVNVGNIAANFANIATNTADIASNVSAITTNAADIASNASVIATNTANIATNTADISSNATLLDNHINDIEAHHAMAGSTFPASPVDGMRFVHNVTGRKIFYIYDLDNAVWVAVQSIGAMTLYVDKTDGTDDSSHGTGVDGDAFATVQYAIDCIPPVFTGNVVININGEDYGEDVVLQGKSSSGDYSITLQGTLSEVASGTQSANGVQGTGADQGQFIDAGNLAGYENYLCYLDADGDYRVIDWSDANSANATGVFTSQPLNGENYKIYDWATVLNSLQIRSQMLVYVYDIELDGVEATGKSVRTDGSSALLYIYRCKISGVANAMRLAQTSVDIYESYFEATTKVIDAIAFAKVQIFRSKIDADGNTAIGLEVSNLGYALLGAGSVVDGTAGANKATAGVRARGNGVCSLYASAADGFCFVRNCDAGVLATDGGHVAPYSTVYSGNTADETPDPASYGYIG